MSGPRLPKHAIATLEESDSSSGFLTAKSKKVEITYDFLDGEEVLCTDEMTIDYVDRKSSFDAVCIIPYENDKNNDEIGSRLSVYLLSCIRPALSFRNYEATGRYESDGIHNQWELPAGIVEKDEVGLDGLNNAASRELKEEIGFFVRPECFIELGHRVFSSVGLSGERISFLMTEVHPQHLDIPTTDGGPLERGGRVCRVSLEQALYMVRHNEISDAKTIIGLYRLAQHFAAAYLF